MTTRRTPRPPMRPQSATTTSKAQSAAKSPSVVRVRACVPIKRSSSVRLSSTVLSELKSMGISPEVAAKVVEAIKTDAAAHGGTVRTKRVLEALKAQHLSATAAAVKILAEFLGFTTERGPEKGEGKPSYTGGRSGGRPKGSEDARKRRQRVDAGQRRIDPAITPEKALANYQQTGSLRESAADLKISTGTLRALVDEARAKITTDGNSSN